MARIDPLFDALLAQDGTDLHLACGSPPLIRRGGRLEALQDTALTGADVEDLLLEIVSQDQRTRITDELDLDFAYAYLDRARFRVSYFYKMTGLGAVFRRIPGHVQTLDELGCPTVLRRVSERRSGLVIVAGPAGSGKTTTMAAIIDHVNSTRPCHILTIELPVELVHQPKRAQVTHREIGTDAGSYFAALRSAYRENADVIFVDELPDNEATRLALRLATSGVLVLSTVRARTAPAAIDRIVSAFPASEQSEVCALLGESLGAIVVQHLLKTTDGRGRVAAFEILLGSSALSGMVREGKTFQASKLMQAGQAVGMQTMDMALERLVAQGAITIETAIEKASDKEAFQKLAARRP
jgi:twitching motility protein PilT